MKIFFLVCNDFEYENDISLNAFAYHKFPEK